MQRGGLRARRRRVVVQRKRESLRIAHAPAIHRLEIFDGHRRGGVGPKRKVDLANDDVAGARVDARFGGQNLFADRLTSHA